MKNPLRFFLPLTIFLLIFVGQVASYSSGPPSGNTGAPGNNTCATSGCHISFDLNSGSGILSLESTVPQEGFTPGETYTITVKMKESGKSIFGFQSLLFGTTSQAGVGTISITDASRTKTLTNVGNAYVMQTKTGSAAADSATWSYDWIAPAKGTGEVTLYGASVAANGNGNRIGDYVYTSTLVLEEAAAASLEDLSEIAAANLYPNPVTDLLSLDLTLEEATPIRWSISDLHGRTWQTGETSTLSSGWNTQFDLSELPAGLYQLELKTASGRWREKIVKR